MVGVEIFFHGTYMMHWIALGKAEGNLLCSHWVREMMF